MMFRQDLILSSTWMNSAGTLGFAPHARWATSEPPGAFVTNPISLPARTPAGDRALISYPGGYLLHTGLPNPGLSRVIQANRVRWAQSSLPIWVHILAANPAEAQQMAQRLEGVEGVSAIELGLPPGVSGPEALEFAQAAFGELPLVISLPLTAAPEPWLAELPRLGVSALTLSAPRGALISATGRVVSGRLFGPSLLPLTMAAVHWVRKLGMQVIAGAGVYRSQDAVALQDAGAWAVQMDGALWKGQDG